MARRLILDTNIVVDIERSKSSWRGFLQDELYLPTIVISEFRVGIELNPDTTKAKQAVVVLSTLLEFCTVLDYTLRIAEMHACLTAEAHRSGTPRGHHDLIIAAHAADTGYSILTRDVAARFNGLTGVRAIDPAALSETVQGPKP